VEALPLIAPRHGVVDASEAGVPPTRPPSGKRPRSRADSTNVERPSVSPPHDDPDYRDEAAGAVRGRPSRPGSSSSSRPRSSSGALKPHPPNSARSSSGLDFHALLAEAKSHSRDAMDAVVAARHHKNSLVEQVAELEKQLLQVTSVEMSVASDLEAAVKEADQLRVALERSQEELALQQALTQEELKSFDDLCAMEAERDRYREESECCAERIRVLETDVAVLQGDRQQLAMKVEAFEKLLCEKHEEIAAHVKTIEEVSAALEASDEAAAVNMTELRAELSAERTKCNEADVLVGQLQQAVATLSSVQARMETAQKVLTEMEEDLSGQLQEAHDALAKNTLECEAEVQKARSDRAVIVKELRRMQTKENDHQDSLTNMRGEVADALEDKKRAEQATATAREETGTQKRAFENATRELCEEQERCRQLEDLVAKTTAERDEKQQTMEQLQQRVKEMAAAAQRANSAAQGTQESLSSQIEGHVETIRKRESELDDERAECRGLKVELKELALELARTVQELHNDYLIDGLSVKASADIEAQALLERHEMILRAKSTAVLSEEQRQHSDTTKALEASSARANLLQVQLTRSTEEQRTLQTELVATTEALRSEGERCASLSKQLIEAGTDLKQRDEEAVVLREETLQLTSQREVLMKERSTLQEQNKMQREDAKHMNEKLVVARTEKLDGIADSQVRIVLLEKQLIVKNNLANGLKAEKERLERHTDDQSAAVDTNTRTIDFLRSDLRRKEEHVVQLKDGNKQNVEKFEAARAELLNRIQQLEETTAEHIAGADEMLALARAGASIEVLQSKLEASQSRAGGILNTAESMTALVAEPEAEEHDEDTSDEEEDEPDEEQRHENAMAALEQKRSSLSGAADSTNNTPPVDSHDGATAMAEDLTSGISTEKWRQRQERREARRLQTLALKTENETVQRHCDALQTALKDLTRQHAALQLKLSVQLSREREEASTAAAV